MRKSFYTGIIINEITLSETVMNKKQASNIYKHNLKKLHVLKKKIVFIILQQCIFFLVAKSELPSPENRHKKCIGVIILTVTLKVNKLNLTKKRKQYSSVINLGYQTISLHKLSFLIRANNYNVSMKQPTQL